MTENDITYIIRGCIFKVYNNLGPGLLESSYEAALEHEMKKANLNIKRQIPLPMIYDTVRMEVGYRLDFLVEEKVIIEVKSIETVTEVHHKQILTYLRLADLRYGILVNFNTDSIANNIFRKVNGFKSH